MSKERIYDRRNGTHVATLTEIVDRLPEGLQRRIQIQGIPKDGPGKYRVPNEYARVFTERRDKK